MNKTHIPLQINWDDNTTAMLLSGVGGEIVSANYAAENLFGCSEGEICNMINSPISSDFNLFNHLIHSRTNSEFSLKLKRVDGTEIEVHISQIKLKNDYGAESNVLLLRDITEKKRLETQLRQSKERNDILFENKLSAICVYDFETFKFLDANQKFLDLYGYTKEELLNLTLFDLTLDPLKTIEAHEQIKTAQCVHIPIRYHKKKDGTAVPIEVFGNFAYWDGRPVVFGVQNDISQRLALEEELKKNEEFLKDVQKLTKIGGWEYNVETGSTLFSDTVFSIYGKKPANPEEGILAYHPDDRSIIEKAFREAIDKKKEYDLTLRLFNSENKCLWVRTMGKPIIENGKVVKILGSLADITDSKNNQMEVIKSEEKYRLLFQNMDYGFELNEIITDKDGEVVDFKILEANDYLKLVTGLDPLTVIGKSYLELRPDADFELIKRFGRVALTGISDTFEFLHPDYNKWIKAHVYSPKAGQFAAIFQDITEGKLVEKKLQESEEKYRNLFENSAAGIAIISAQGNTINANSKWCEMLGYSIQELMGEHVTRFLSPSEMAKMGSQEGLLQKEGSLIIEREVIKKEGSPAYFEGRVTLMDDGTRQIIANDITERKKVEMALENYKVRLEELVEEKTKEIKNVNQHLNEQIIIQKATEEKLKESLLREFEINEFRKRLITNIGHEFRTPLTTIISSMELLERYGRNWGDDKWAEHKQKVNSSTDYLSNLIDNSLKIEEPADSSGEFNKSLFDLYEIIKSAIKDNTGKVESKHNFIFKYNADKVIEIDKDKVKIIIGNLLSNAVKFSPEGGDIIVEVSESKNSLNIKISDNGIGIGEEDVDHLFEPFYRGANANMLPGVGLGLTIAKKYVDICGGLIRVESKPGKGSTFIINLPVYS